jgi:trehalose utilization protein
MNPLRQYENQGHNKNNEQIVHKHNKRVVVGVTCLVIISQSYDKMDEILHNTKDKSGNLLMLINLANGIFSFV